MEAICGGGDVPHQLRREMDADWAGLNAVWDGVSAHNDGSIDWTWTGPILALAAEAGFAAAHPRSDAGTLNDTWRSWVERLHLVTRCVGEGLIFNGFELSRAVPFLTAAAPLSACVYEYVRTGCELADDNARLGPPGSAVFGYLSELTASFWSRFP